MNTCVFFIFRHRISLNFGPNFGPNDVELDETRRNEPIAKLEEMLENTDCFTHSVITYHDVRRLSSAMLLTVLLSQRYKRG